MSKDRERILAVLGTSQVDILYRRSSAHPVEYAIVLRRLTPNGPEAVVSADNSHPETHVDEHHMHRYRDGERQPAERLPFDVRDANDAMGKIIGWMADNWAELIA